MPTASAISRRKPRHEPKAEGKTLSAVIQDALRQAGVARRLQQFRDVQGYWNRKALERGLLKEEDLNRYLAECESSSTRTS